MSNKDSKKICFVSMYAYSLFNSKCDKPHGGSEVQLYQLAKKLALTGNFSVSFIVGDFGQNTEERHDNISVVKAFPLRHRQFKYITGLFYQFKFFQVLHQINADVYIQRAAGFETGLLAIFCKLFGKKFIYMTASSIDVDGSFKKINWIANIFYSFGLRNASAIVTQNKDHQKLIKKNYGKESIVIRNSFIIPKEIPPAKKKNFILWVGSAQKLKQPQIFLEMAQKIPQEKFVMIIPRHDKALWGEIKKEADKILNLQFIEKVPFDKINEYFAEAKLFVNTSTYEGFPNTFVQAAMNGTLVFSLNVNPDNFLEEYDCGFYFGGEVAKMVECVEVMSKDALTLSKKGLNARKYAEENHNIDNNIKKIIEIIKKNG